MVANLVEESIANLAANTDMANTSTGTKMSDVKIEHLDYGYIGKCTDVKYLEAILKVLRSGKEGLFPDLIEFAENRLRLLAPSSKQLNLPQPIKQKWALNKDELRDISDDLESFVSEIKTEEESIIVQSNDGVSSEENSAPVRGNNEVISPHVNGESVAQAKSDKTSNEQRIKSGDYRAWDKLNVDEVCEQIDKTDEEVKKVQLESVRGAKLPSDEVKKVDVPDVEVEKRANKEKEKGNESFRANDFDEAIVYYSRSLKFLESAAVYNNRCLAYLKKEDFKSAIIDAEQVLSMDKDNLKALLRISQAYFGLKEYNKARVSIEKVLELDPGNKTALKTKEDINKKCPPPAPGAKRLLIEECDEDDEEESVNTESNHEQNGVCSTEEQKPANEIEIESEKSKFVHAAKSEMTAGNVKSGEKAEEKPMEVEDIEGKNDIWGSEDVKQSEDDEYYDCSNKTPAPSPPVENASNDTSLKSQVFQNGSTKKQPKPEPVIPENVMYHKNAANKCYHSGQYHEAMLEYSNAIDKMTLADREVFKTAYGALWANRAACHVKMGDLKQAIVDCEKAFEADSTNAKVLVRRAACYRGIERYKEAYVDLQKAVELNSSLFSTVQTELNRVKQCLISEIGDKWSEKLPKFNCYGVESSGEKFNRLKSEGNDFVKKKDYESAIKLYTECIEADSEKPVAFANRAQCYMSLNNFELAENDCNKALELLEEITDDNLKMKVYYRRCIARKSSGVYKGAMDDLTKVMKLQPKNEAYKKLFAELMTLHRSQAASEKAKGDVKIEPKTAEKSGKKVQIVEVEDDDDDEDEIYDPDQEMKSVTSNQKPESSLKSEPSSKDVEMTDISEQFKANEADDSKKKTELTNPKASKSQVEKKHIEPVLNSQTPFEFAQAWQSVKHLNDTKVYAKLLDQVSDFSKVITLKLDAGMLSTLCEVLAKEFLDRPLDCLRHFESLAKAQRLSFLTMFFSETDKVNVKNILETLNGFAKTNPEVKERVSIVNKKFKL